MKLEKEKMNDNVKLLLCVTRCSLSAFISHCFHSVMVIQYGHHICAYLLTLWPFHSATSLTYEFLNHHQFFCSPITRFLLRMRSHNCHRFTQWSHEWHVDCGSWVLSTHSLGSRQMKVRCVVVCCHHSPADPCRGLVGRSHHDRVGLQKEVQVWIK